MLHYEDFSPMIFNCVDGFGSFYLPADDQYRYIDDKGNLNPPANNPFAAFFRVFYCAWSLEKVEVEIRYSRSLGRGWYILLYPDQDTFGYNYNEMVIVFFNDELEVEELVGVRYIIDILPHPNASLFEAKPKIQVDENLKSFNEKTMLLILVLIFLFIIIRKPGTKTPKLKY